MKNAIQSQFKLNEFYELFAPRFVIGCMNYTLRIAILSVAASAIAAAATYKISLPVDVVLDGHELSAGDYRVDVNNDTAVLQKGKQKVETKVRTETVDQKFGATSVRYVQASGNRYTMNSISVGGTKTKLIFEPAKTVASGL